MSYLNVDEIEASLEALEATYPDRAERIALPHKTAEGRRCHAMRIGPPGTSAALIATGGIHAREWVPPDALVYLAADLLEAHQLRTGLRYGARRFSADEVCTVVDELGLVLFPCVNPDGRRHSQTVEPLWRKNRRRVVATPQCIGVDLNRNFDLCWEFRRCFATDSDVSASDDPCHPFVYVGPNAASEPETRNVVWLIGRTPGARWFVDVHSYVPAMYHAWGVDENQADDPAMNFSNPTFDGLRGRAGDATYREFTPEADIVSYATLTRAMVEAVADVEGTEYEFGQSFALYPTSGTSDDYVYSLKFADPSGGGILGFTIECGRSFQPPFTEAQVVMKEVAAALLALCATATSGTDRVTATTA